MRRSRECGPPASCWCHTCPVLRPGSLTDGDWSATFRALGGCAFLHLRDPADDSMRLTDVAPLVAALLDVDLDAPDGMLHVGLLRD